MRGLILASWREVSLLCTIPGFSVTPDFFSSPPYFISSLLRLLTPIAPLCLRHFNSPKKLASSSTDTVVCAISAFAEKFREESSFTVFGIRTQSLAASSNRSTRELHHPGNTIPRQISLDRNDLGGELLQTRANKQSARLVSPDSDPLWLVSFCLILCSSRSVRCPQKQALRLRYPESKRTSFFCQALFFKKLRFWPIFRLSC